jgi:plastocyanin
MRNLLIAAIVIILILVAGVLLWQNLRGEEETSTPTQDRQDQTNQPATSSGSENEEEATTITYTNNGFSPTTVTIKSGETIRWINESDRDVEIGANPHPIHTGNKEVSGGEFVLKLAPGESSTVTITKTGENKYHDHLRSAFGGTIIVE